MSVFTAFAITGDPNKNSIDVDMQDVQWKPINSMKPPFKCLIIGENLSFEDFPEAERMKAWDEIFEATKHKLF